MPRRCSTCSTALVPGVDGCSVCHLLNDAALDDAAARALHELLVATENLDENDTTLTTAIALDRAIVALERSGSNTRHVARLTSRALEPHRRTRRGAPA